MTEERAALILRNLKARTPRRLSETARTVRTAEQLNMTPEDIMALVNKKKRGAGDD